ncbi:MAG: hypothetical protein NVSMB27_29380 [Ktedonobacteraceae bacterium]
MLTPERISFIVFTVPPLLLLVVIFFTRPAARRLLGAFVGGFAFAVLHISWDTVAHAAGWWHYPFTTETHAPLVWYMVGSVFWGATSALIGWRIQRRWDLRGLIMFLVAIGVLGTASDFAGAAVASADLIVFGAGIIPVLADTVCSGTNSLVAQVGMRLVAGRAQADRLAFS